jgi:predicted PurR-regulated permease PerM
MGYGLGQRILVRGFRPPTLPTPSRPPRPATLSTALISRAVIGIWAGSGAAIAACVASRSVSYSDPVSIICSAIGGFMLFGLLGFLPATAATILYLQAASPTERQP